MNTNMGIYKIENTRTKCVYIGSTKDFSKREKQHFSMLEKNKHHSSKLQRSYNTSKDKSIFKFEIIEEVDDACELKKREQYYIDLYDSFNTGYNCLRDTNNFKYN